MDATKLFLVLILFFPIFNFGQESKYPKDTIYVKFEKNGNTKKWFGNYGYGTDKQEGILFNIKDNNNKSMSFFYDIKQIPDTLCSLHLKDYSFLNLKEIDIKEKEYYKKRFGRNALIRNKNWVFHTFLIEIISEEKFVIYPVIWRSEGVIF